MGLLHCKIPIVRLDTQCQISLQCLCPQNPTNSSWHQSFNDCQLERWKYIPDFKFSSGEENKYICTCLCILYFFFLPGFYIFLNFLLSLNHYSYKLAKCSNTVMALASIYCLDAMKIFFQLDVFKILGENILNIVIKLQSLLLWNCLSCFS